METPHEGIVNRKGRGVIRYSCDRCHRVLDSEELRYVVRLEAFAAIEPGPDAEEGEDRDHLLEIDEILERLDDEQSDAVCEDIYARRRFDMCGECYRKFALNPLGRELQVPLKFSKN